MAVISTYICNNDSSNSNLVAYNYHFRNISYIEIPQIVHQKEAILHVQAYDENHEMIYPNIRIEDLKVVVEFSVKFSGIIKII